MNIAQLSLDLGNSLKTIGLLEKIITQPTVPGKKTLTCEEIASLLSKKTEGRKRVYSRNPGYSTSSRLFARTVYEKIKDKIVKRSDKLQP